MGLLVRLIICLFLIVVPLFIYIDKQNDLRELRLRIPAIAKEVRTIHEQNRRLQYEIDRFESPIHLMELARKPEFSHLKFPSTDTIIILSEEKGNVD
jgi:hypothetical protein